MVPSSWLCRSQQTRKFLKRQEYQRNLDAGQEATELDMEQQTGSKWGKEYVKAVYCHPVYLTYMQSTSCTVLDWMKHKLESRCQEK